MTNDVIEKIRKQFHKTRLTDDVHLTLTADEVYRLLNLEPTPIAAHGAGAVTEALRHALRNKDYTWRGIDRWNPPAVIITAKTADEAHGLHEALIAFAALRPDEAAGQGEAVPRVRMKHGWVCWNDGPGGWCWCGTREECLHELSDETTIRPATAVEHSLWLMSRDATPRPEAPVAPDIVPVAWTNSAQLDKVKGTGNNALLWGEPLPYHEDMPLYGPDALAALSSELAEAKREMMELQAENRGLFLAHRIQHDLREAAEAEVARLKDENKELVAGLQVLATTFYKEDQHRDYAKHVLDRARSLTATKGG